MNERKKQEAIDRAAIRFKDNLSTKRKGAGDAGEVQAAEGQATSDYEEAIGVAPGTLKHLPDNERLFPIRPDRLEAMRASIRVQGIRTPLIVDRESKVVVCGNTRLKIALELELSTVPVIWRDIPEADRVNYAIRDNVERRQLERKEISALIERYLPELEKEIEQSKKERASRGLSARQGKETSSTGSAYKKTADKIARETGAIVQERQIKHKREKSKKQSNSPGNYQKDNLSFRKLKQPVFDRAGLKITVYLPDEKTFETWRENVLKRYPTWAKK